MRYRVAVLLSALLLFGQVASGDSQAVLKATITDAVTGQPTPCTVHMTDAAGARVTENPSLRDGFRCAGSFTKNLPPGRTRLRFTRGIETESVTREVDLAAGRETEVSISLKRRVDLRQRGWYAGDSHVHMIHGERDIPVDFDFVAVTARSEDLQYLSLAQAWAIDDPTPENLSRELRQRSTADCQLAWNMEAPKNYFKGDAGRCLGHCWNINVGGRTPDGQDVIRILGSASAHDYEIDKPSYANFESHQLIRAHGGASFYSHPARWWIGAWGGRAGYPKLERMRVSNMAVELPLDTVIGPTYDGLDVMTSGGEFPANEKAFALWALLQNHGYRVAATASSDACFDRPGGGVPGMARTYTFLPGGFSWAGVARATAAGRTFVTTGPLLLATLADAPPGSSLPADGRTRVLRIEAWASGKESKGLTSVQVLRNGELFKQIDLQDKPASFQTELEIRESQPAWYCVRLTGHTPQQRAITGAFYFDSGQYKAPAPTPAKVRVKVIDARTGAALPATLTEVTYQGTIPSPGQQHRVEQGAATLSIAATSRLRADVKGYAPVTKSPFLDYPPLLEAVTRMSDQDLLNWNTFEKMRELLGNVELTFALERS